MCDSCGCTPCNTCGAPVEDGVCSSCGEKPTNCTCEPLDEELNYDEEEDEDFDDEDEEEDEDFEEDEDEDFDEDEDEDEEEYEDDDEDFDDDDGKAWGCVATHASFRFSRASARVFRKRVPPARTPSWVRCIERRRQSEPRIGSQGTCRRVQSAEGSVWRNHPRQRGQNKESPVDVLDGAFLFHTTCCGLSRDARWSPPGLSARAPRCTPQPDRPEGT